MSATMMQKRKGSIHVYHPNCLPIFTTYILVSETLFNIADKKLIKKNNIADKKKIEKNSYRLLNLLILIISRKKILY